VVFLACVHLADTRKCGFAFHTDSVYFVYFFSVALRANRYFLQSINDFQKTLKNREMGTATSTFIDEYLCNQKRKFDMSHNICKKVYKSLFAKKR